MSTVADYSILTKAFLAAGEVDFSRLYTQEGSLRAFAVVPLKLGTPLTTREALHFDWSKLGTGDMETRVSCRDADGNFIGNIVRVQPSKMNGSIRLVAKVAVPAASENDVEDLLANTFVLLRTDPSTNQDLPIAVATISAGYKIRKHTYSGNDPLDAVDNANYVSFTLHNLNGYTSVDFDPDAYVTYDVTDALSRRIDVIEGVGGIKGLHIAFNSNTGDILLSDAKGNVIDQANLHLDLSTDTIIAEGEEGYKYVKTDINQNVHSAKAFMDPKSDTSAFGSSGAVDYDTQHASLVRFALDDTHVCNGIRVCWKQAQEGSEQATQHDDIFCIFLKDGDGTGGTKQGSNFLSCCKYFVNDSGQLVNTDPTWLKTLGGRPVEVSGPSKIFSEVPKFVSLDPVYSHDAFVHTVGNSSLADWDECFKLMGFHVGDDIPLGTDLPALMQVMTSGELDPEEFIHGENADNAAKVVTQRENAKAEMVAYNSRRPALTENRHQGTIIDYTGLDVRDGRITLGCGRVGEADAEAFQKVNYGIQMRDRSGDKHIPNRSESLDFTVSHNRGEVKFDGNGHATSLTSSTLLSIEAGSYISGAPTCLILAKVTRKPKDATIPEGSLDPQEGSPVLTPVRMTAGFSVSSNYDAPSGLQLTLHDYRDNILGILNPNGATASAPAIIEVQALYTHPNAETVPAQQMHTYIGKWMYNSTSYSTDHPECSFLCNKIEDWMTSVGLTDAQNQGSELYVVIRVY